MFCCSFQAQAQVGGRGAMVCPGWQNEHYRWKKSDLELKNFKLITPNKRTFHTEVQLFKLIICCGHQKT